MRIFTALLIIATPFSALAQGSMTPGYTTRQVAPSQTASMTPGATTMQAKPFPSQATTNPQFNFQPLAVPTMISPNEVYRYTGPVPLK